MIQFLEYLAVVSAGIFGVLLARSKGMDLVGICWVAFTVAFGGGTLRDLLLDRSPLFWIENEHYTLTLFAIAITGALLPKVPSALERWLVLPDALGLALFSVVGAGIALESEQFEVSYFVASLFGVITGSFGGVIADIICNEVPRTFMPTTPLYSLCGFAGCWAYIGAIHLDLPEDLALTSAVVLIAALRLAAVRWNWRLPVRAD